MTVRGKTQILQILGLIALKKFHFSTTSGKKSVKFHNFWLNNCIFMKPIAKYCTVKKISWGKISFCKISAYLHSQFK